MHDDHEIFEQAVRDKKKVILTYFSTEHNLNLTRLCIPVRYSLPKPGEESDYYHVWDSEGDVGEQLLGLPPSQIIYMELSNESFA